MPLTLVALLGTPAAAQSDPDPDEIVVTGDIPGHATHERGLDIDIRMLRKANDQCTWGTRWSYTTYDRAATRVMIKKFRALAPGHIKVIYFNDPVLIREGLTTWYSGHDDHIHVRFCEKIHPIAIYDC